MTYECKICKTCFDNRQTKYVHQLSCELKQFKDKYDILKLRCELLQQPPNIATVTDHVEQNQALNNENRRLVEQNQIINNDNMRLRKANMAQLKEQNTLRECFGYD